MSPPSIRARSLEIESPSPVPPNSAAVLASAWVNGLNNLFSCSSLIPIPVSRIANSRQGRASGDSPALYCTPSLIIPRWVNLIALPVRLMRICRKRIASVSNHSGNSPSNSTDSSRFFSRARSRMSFATLSTISKGEARRKFSSSLPASILLRSRISFTSSRMYLPLSRMVRAASATSPSAPAESARLSANPMTAVMGVRISWLMCAKNSVLNLSPVSRLLTLASSSAVRSATSRLTFVRRRSTSCARA